MQPTRKEAHSGGVTVAPEPSQKFLRAMREENNSQHYSENRRRDVIVRNKYFANHCSALLNLISRPIRFLCHADDDLFAHPAQLARNPRRRMLHAPCRSIAATARVHVPWLTLSALLKCFVFYTRGEVRRFLGVVGVQGQLKPVSCHFV